MKTHLKIVQRLNGKVISIEENLAIVELDTITEMVADEKGLIHGGFIFSAADFAAMVAVNNPNVVLASSNVKFFLPTKVNETLFFTATVIENKDNSKYKVNVIGLNQNEKKVFEGIFECVVLKRHILENN